MRRLPALVVTFIAVGIAIEAALPSGAGASWWNAVALFVLVPFVGALAYTIVADGPRSLRGLVQRR